MFFFQLQSEKMRNQKIDEEMFYKHHLRSAVRNWKTRNQIVIALLMGIIVSFIAGSLIGWSIPSDNVMLTEDRPKHVIFSFC